MYVFLPFRRPMRLIEIFRMEGGGGGTTIVAEAAFGLELAAFLEVGEGMTTGEFEVTTVPGDHFFIRANGPYLARKISQMLVAD